MQIKGALQNPSLGSDNLLLNKSLSVEMSVWFLLPALGLDLSQACQLVNPDSWMSQLTRRRSQSSMCTVTKPPLGFIKSGQGSSYCPPPPQPCPGLLAQRFLHMGPLGPPCYTKDINLQKWTCPRGH